MLSVSKKFVIAGMAAWMCVASCYAAPMASDTVFVPANRSMMLTLPVPMGEVVVASPDIADVHAHNSTHLTIMGKRNGQTNIRITDKKGALMRDMDVVVGYDLPAIRRSLKNFLPNENIGVEMVNTGVALTGQVSNSATGEKAVKITQDFLASSGEEAPTVLNFMQVTTGQQVMLRVRVGEIQRTALKNLGIDINVIGNGAGNNGVLFGTGGGIASIVAPTAGQTAVSPGVFLLPGGNVPTNTRGVLQGRWQPGGGANHSYSGLIKALEEDGLFKTLAEPNLVAISGEEAEFLSGGEIPIPVVQNGNNSNAVGIQYKPFGVAVKFSPSVLSENRIRMSVAPEVSEISANNHVTMNGFDVPSIETRRAKTTVELAPGESFMIAGLISDNTRASISQLPGAKELPILGALFRSTEFQRNETELVIAVTPYIVDPVKSSDIKLPTDDFRPASQMESFFFGALGSTSNPRRGRGKSQPAFEGPLGFMVD